MEEPLTLGIESSCDETAAAVVTPGRKILSSVVWGQNTLHAAFGGVVPEIAARAHAERLDGVAQRALDEAGVGLGDIGLVAVTAGPGLIGGVFAGVMFAKALAAARGLPVLGVNHLAGHALTPRLTDDLDFPYLMLLVSGGHCQFLAVAGPETFHRLGGTLDDAPGEAFDKLARLMALPFPGGPALEAEAEKGSPTAYAFPRPLLDRAGADMSFSGLKTAARRAVDQAVAADGGLRVSTRADIAASFQAAVADLLAQKSARALAAFEAKTGTMSQAFAVAGGVAANKTLRAALSQVAEHAGVPFLAPPLSLCTDNGAMIAWAGIEAWRTGRRDDLSFPARPRWPLDQTATPILGFGKRGPKS